MKKNILAVSLLLPLVCAAADTREYDDRAASDRAVTVVIDVEVNGVRHGRANVAATPGREFAMHVPLNETDVLQLRCESRVPTQGTLSVVCKPSSSQHAVWSQQFIWMEPQEGRSDHMDIVSPSGHRIKVETRYSPVKRDHEERT